MQVLEAEAVGGGTEVSAHKVIRQCYHYSAPSYQCQKRANTGEFGRKRLRLSQPCRTYVPMQPNNDEPTATDAAQTELDRFAVLMSVALDQLG